MKMRYCGRETELLKKDTIYDVEVIGFNPQYGIHCQISHGNCTTMCRTYGSLENLLKNWSKV